MANTNLFKSLRGKVMPASNAINMAGGTAYALSAEQTLAQYAANGCLNATFYASADEQLGVVLELAAKVDPAFVAKTAIYCRERGYMKDMPALLAAALTVRGQEYLPAVFARVITNGKMLRNFVQIIRSGAVGRKSLGSRPKKLIQTWLNNATEKELLNASIGSNPSLADVVKMVHPKPVEAWREAFFAWLIGKPFAVASLPPLTKAYLAYKDDRSLPLPDVPFQMLTALELSAADWARIASQGSWQMIRMNLNTFARQGVFALDGATEQVAAKLRDAESIAKARAFPYQLLAAYKSVSDAVPQPIRLAIEDALETSLANVPVIEGQVVVCADVSGSMSFPVTGARGPASSSVRCIDVAALVAAATLRKNPNAIVLPFEADVVKLDLNARDTVLTNAQKLAAVGGGGTNCSAPLKQLNRNKTKVDLVVIVSDNESWVDSTRMGATALMKEWAELKVRNPDARLVCIDVQPSGTTQAAGQPDVLNVGGFTDEVFKITAAFAAGQLNPDFWVGEITAIGL